METVQAVKKFNSISREWLNFRRRPILCKTLYRNPMQASKFGGTFDQLFLRIFLNFHRRCLSTSSIPWYKKVKNDQKLKSRGSYLKSMGFDAGIRLGGVDEKSPPLSPNQPCWAAPAVLSGDLWPSRYAKFLWMTSRSWEKLPVKRDRGAAGRDSHTACVRSSGYARWTWSPTYSHSRAG